MPDRPRRPLRVVLVPGTLGGGGTEHQFVLLARRLAERGHDVTVAPLLPGGLLESEVESFEPLGYFPLGMPSSGRVGTWLEIIRAPNRLRRMLKASKKDIVYSALDLSNIVASRACREFPTKVVWGIRSDGPAGWLSDVLARLSTRRSFSVPLVISNSHAGVDYYKGLGFAPGQWAVVPNGIDCDRFRPDRAAGESLRSALGVEPCCRIVGMVGRIDANKGQDVFLRMARTVIDASGDDSVLFWIIGAGKDSSVQRLQHLARDLGLEQRVRWLGHRTDMVRVYNALDVFCSPSRREGFPNAVGEAMACGLPVVATDVGDTAIVAGSTGRIVPPNEPQRIADEVIRALQGKFTGVGGRERIAFRFSAEKMVERTENLFYDVAKIV